LLFPGSILAKGSTAGDGFLIPWQRLICHYVALWLRITTGFRQVTEPVGLLLLVATGYGTHLATRPAGMSGGIRRTQRRSVAVMVTEGMAYTSGQATE
jgi:hypothetical protein